MIRKCNREQHERYQSFNKCSKTYNTACCALNLTGLLKLSIFLDPTENNTNKISPKNGND